MGPGCASLALGLLAALGSSGAREAGPKSAADTPVRKVREEPAAAKLPSDGRPVALAGVAVRRVRTQEPVVALTFDACASPGAPQKFDAAVFKILRREQVPATVFMTGMWIDAHRGAARVLAREPLIEIGNHAFSHPPFSRLTREQAAREIDATESRIRALGHRSVGFRPPFGDWARPLLSVAKERRMPVVLWDVLSLDAGGHFRVKTMVDMAVRKVRPGSIVIFHINGRGPKTHRALPQMLQRLRARGFRFVKISELLALGDARVEAARPAEYARRTPGGGGGRGARATSAR